MPEASRRVESRERKQETKYGQQNGADHERWGKEGEKITEREENGGGARLLMAGMGYKGVRK